MRYLFFTLFISGALISFASLAYAQSNVTTVSITPNTTIVWEAESYTPPFYKGKALFPDGGVMRLIAFPPATQGDPESLEYVWEVDGMVDGEASGIGRQSYVYKSDFFGGAPFIVVTIKNAGKDVGTGALKLPITKPRALLYTDLPLAGIVFGRYESAVAGEEVSLEAYPLYFTTTTKSSPALSYTWTLNGTRQLNPLGNVPRLVLRSETTSTSTVGVSISNALRGLEVASGDIQVILEN